MAAWAVAVVLIVLGATACGAVAPPTPIPHVAVAPTVAATIVAPAPTATQTGVTASPAGTSQASASTPAASESAPGGVRLATASSTATTIAAANELEAELARIMAVTPPRRDLVDLARRYKVRPGTPTPDVPAVEAVIGHERQFWVADSANKRYFQVKARLQRQSEHVDFYVQEGERVEDAAADRSLETIERRILPALTTELGADRLSLNKLRVTILNTRLRGLVGYYSSVDEYPGWVAPFSNERPLIVMSLGAGQPGSRTYDSRLAHELEHLLQWRLDPGEQTWVNEGTAEVAIRAVGLQPSGNYQSFLQRPDTQLTAWAEEVSDTPAHYGAADLFFNYVAQRYGGYRAVGEILTRPERGTAGVEAGLRAWTGDASLTFEKVFVDWAIANWANQPDAADGRYGYRNLQVRSREERLDAVPTRVAGTVRQFGTRYYDIARASALTVSAAPSVKLVAAAERSGPIWWSNRGDSTNARLTREVDLTGVTRARMSFALWHDLEKDYDYGYVSASRDGGATWTTLRGRTGSSSDPTGANYGVGFTGKTGGQWLDEEVDLTPFGGAKALVRFELVTDDAYNGPGFCLDAIEVPEIGWRDRADDAGWRADGFVRVRNALPGRLAAHLVAVVGREVQVVPVGLGERLAVPPELRGADRLVLVVSGLTPLTSEPVTFDLTVEGA